jgi:hypothetical protein
LGRTSRTVRGAAVQEAVNFGNGHEQPLANSENPNISPLGRRVRAVATKPEDLSRVRPQIERLALYCDRRCLLLLLHALHYDKVPYYTSHYMHVTSEKGVLSGNWWRFDRYELKDEYIRPVAGSPLRSYEPWNSYKPPRGKETRKQPYHSLLELVRNLDSGELDQATRDLAIEGWCGQHGLLGVHLLINIVIPMVAGQPTSWGASGQGLDFSGKFVTSIPADFPTDARAISLGMPNLAMWPVRQFSDHLAVPEFKFFPSALKSPSGFIVAPAPLTEQFWLEYAEPIETFLDAGRLLRKAVEQLQVIRDSKKRLVEKHETFENPKSLIDALISSVKSVIRLKTKSRFELALEGGSLLSNFAMMAVLDFTNTRPLTCGNPKCGSFFVSRSTEARYCSPQCRNAVHIRRYRKRIARNAKGNTK